MNLIKNKLLLIISFIILLIFANTIYAQNLNNVENSKIIINQFKSITKSTKLNLTTKIKLNFHSYHPQGLLKIDNYFFLTAVETIVKPEKFESLQEGYDRSPGKGIGHLFKFDFSGNLVAEIRLGQGIIYHPGGIDYDGQFIWIPVAEYRPNSRSIIYRTDPRTLATIKIFRFNDHIGALAYNRDENTLIGISWGSRRFYTWKLDESLHRINGETIDEYKIPKYSMRLNGNHYIDYQDCHYFADNCMVCSGLNKYTIPNVGEVAFGGMDLVDLDVFLAVHQVPLNYWIKSELVVSNNPFYFEFIENRFLLYFIPEDNKSTLYVFEIDLGSSP